MRPLIPFVFADTFAWFNKFFRCCAWWQRWTSRQADYIRTVISGRFFKWVPRPCTELPAPAVWQKYQTTQERPRSGECRRATFLVDTRDETRCRDGAPPWPQRAFSAMSRDCSRRPSLWCGVCFSLRRDEERFRSSLRPLSFSRVIAMNWKESLVMSHRQTGVITRQRIFSLQLGVACKIDYRSFANTLA